MKKNLRYLLFSVLATFAFLIPHKIIGMDTPGQPDQQQLPMSLKKFSEMSEKEYEGNLNVLFEGVSSKKEKAAALLKWSEMAGVPILALDKHSLFFYANLHIYPANSNLCPSIDFSNDNTGIEDKFTTYFHDDKVEIEDNRDKPKPKISKAVTTDLTNNSICYLYKTKHGVFFDNNRFNLEADTHYQNFPPFSLDSISREFLKDYIISIEKINYLDNVIKGLRLLPKSIVELMVGKALYLSNAKGVSRTIITSHCQLVVNYLGLMPGVFLECHKQKNQITETLIHEIGHLIDYTVLQPFYTNKKGQRSIKFYYKFPELQKLYAKRNELFRGNEENYKEHKANDRRKTNVGFITNYSEKNREEDFAEHFVNFIMDREKFTKLAVEEATAKPNKDARLLNKATFMQTLLMHKLNTNLQLAKDAGSVI